ncbi:MAG: ABC transporter permease [Hellea sp.]
MLRKLLQFELSLHTRQIGFWLALIVMIGLGLLFSSHEDFAIGVAGGERVKVNGAIPVALTISAFSLFSIFFAAVFVVTGVMRDDTHKSVEMVHATPVKTRDMLIARMLGVWIATVVSLSGLVIGTIAGPFMPWGDAETFQSFNLLHYIQPFFLFIIINALLVSAIYTAIAVTTRNRALVYVSAVGLLVLYLVGGVIAGERPDEWIAALVDPFGATSLAVETQYWPAAEQNENMAPFLGWVGLNRLVYGLVGLALFGLAFMFSTRGIHLRKGKTRLTDSAPAHIPTQVKAVKPNLNAGFTLKAFWTRIKFEYLSTVRSTAFIILVGIALSLFGVSLLVAVFMGASTALPTSRFMTQVALGSLLFPMLIIMIFFGSDIMWRDRTANIHGILDATPVRDVSLLFAKWGALALLLLTLVAGLLIAGMIAQIGFGWDRVPVVPATFIAIGIVSFFVGFFFQGMLVMFLQNFMPGRIIGMLVSGAVLVGLIFFIGQLPFYHPLMNFGDAGAGGYSEMAGFSNVKSFGWEFAYWMGLILILGALSIWVWRRGHEISLKRRLKTIRKRMSLPSLTAAAVGLMAFIGFGYAGLQSYKAEGYMNSDQREANSAEFEKLVADIWQNPEPRITKVSVDANFYPKKQIAEFSGSYVIDNPHDKPISLTTVFSGVGPNNITKLDIEGAAILEGDELSDTLRKDHNVLQVKFDPPLAPGESRSVNFATKFSAPTLTEGSSIARNGTFVNNTDALLVFGNLEAGFISNPDRRRKHDLGERVKWPDRDNQDARRYNLLTSFSGYSDYVDFDARVCTVESQIPVAPGKFEGETVSDGRRCRDYKSINPIHNFFSFLTAEYEVRKEVWNNPNGKDVELEIYFHPAHDFNIDLMFDAMRQSMDSYTTTFSPYQYAQLRIMEFPFASFAQAFAGTVPFSENIGFVQDPGNADDPKRVDFATYVTMHEIGHQWFAHQLIGAYAKGSNLLSEGLTENATMIAYETHYDFAKARRMHEERATVQYLTQRTFERDDEPILAEAEGQGYLNYNKTSWVFWGMRQTIGNDVIQGAVKRFLTEYHGTKGAPYPTTLELIEILKEDTDPKYHQLIEDYWNKITFWDLSFTDEIKATANGDSFAISIPIKVDKKYASEEDGKETSVIEIDDAELNEWVEIGFYTEDPKDDLGASPFATRVVNLTKAETVQEFTLDKRPSHIVLDPKRALIERNVNDNTKALPKKLASNG